MAKAKNIEFIYCDDRDTKGGDIPCRGDLVIIEAEKDTDFDAVKELKNEQPHSGIQFSDAIMVKVRERGSGDKFRTVGVVGLSIVDSEIIPFNNYEAADNIAQMIRTRSKQISNRPKIDSR
jgi:hypothetical protein